MTRRPNALKGAGAARPLVAALVALTVLAGAAPADAATRRATDREAGIRFTLDNRVLTVRLLPRAPAGVRREVRGERIEAACGTSLAFTIRGVTVRRTRLWPEGRSRLRYRFSRNISRRARWCALEHPAGGDIAYVNL